MFSSSKTDPHLTPFLPFKYNEICFSVTFKCVWSFKVANLVGQADGPGMLLLL